MSLEISSWDGGKGLVKKEGNYVEAIYVNLYDGREKRLSPVGRML